MMLNITYICKYGAEHNTIVTHKCWNSWVRDRTPCNLSSGLRIPEEVAVKRCHYAWRQWLSQIKTSWIVVVSIYLLIVVNHGDWFVNHGNLVVNIYIVWVNFITTEPCSLEPWTKFLEGNHPLLWSQDSGEWNIIIYPALWCLGIYWGCTGIWWDIQGSMKGISVYYIMLNPN